MASENDVILLSCLTRAPAAGEATAAVRSALQRVIVRPPLAMIHNSGAGGALPGQASSSHLRAICPSAHTAVVDGKLLRAFTSTRARTVLAGLSPLPVSGAAELPTVVAGVAGAGSGLCFLGQRASSEGHSAFSIRRDAGLQDGETAAEAGQALRIDDLMYEFGPRSQASARALYDLWGTSNGDVLGGCLQESGKSTSPLARLATEWDCSINANRTLGSAPPPACSSLLLAGGACPPSTASLALRGNIETLSTAAEVGLGPQVHAGRKRNGPFCGRGREGTGGAVAGSAGGDDTAEIEWQEQAVRWDEDLQTLLSGSENMAEFAAKRRDGEDGSDGGGDASSDEDGPEKDDDTVIQERKDGGGVGEKEMPSGREDRGDTFRADLDFSEKLWELAARAADVEHVRSAIALAFDAVGEGHIFPVISRDNQTGVGRHLREGVAMAREARCYHDGRSVGVEVPRDDAKTNAWRERGSAILTGAESLAAAFVELGVHKVTRDLLHWLEAHAGVLSADVERVLPATANDKPLNDESGKERPKASSTRPRPADRRLDRLVTLADTLDLVALAQSYGAPWRQVRALAHAGLAALGRAAAAGGSVTGGASPFSPVFPLVLPKPIPPRARSNLAHPVFWELFLEPAGGAGGESAAASLGGKDTVSYAMVTADLFQLKGVDEPPVLSGGAARAAQAALEGCPAHFVREVLSSVAGVDSFAELKRRQQERRVQGARVGAGGDATAVFVCEHTFTPW